jgi:hypothetical protein
LNVSVYSCVHTRACDVLPWIRLLWSLEDFPTPQMPSRDPTCMIITLHVITSCGSYTRHHPRGGVMCTKSRRVWPERGFASGGRDGAGSLVRGSLATCAVSCLSLSLAQTGAGVHAQPSMSAVAPVPTSTSTTLSASFTSTTTGTIAGCSDVAGCLDHPHCRECIEEINNTAGFPHTGTEWFKLDASALTLDSSKRCCRLRRARQTRPHRTSFSQHCLSWGFPRASTRTA